MNSLNDPIASKTTYQNAPLERLLATLRINKIIPFIKKDSAVLDFGCGRHLLALEALASRAKLRIGVDSCFKGNQVFVSPSGAYGLGGFEDAKKVLGEKTTLIDIVISLACFEHLEKHEFLNVLNELFVISSPEATIVGTVPTPRAKPVLEFLSYRLGLIDRSQIEDHKIYYDGGLLEKTLNESDWVLNQYRTFQFGMNGFFVMTKRNRAK
jgi:hypothetical protein